MWKIGQRVIDKQSGQEATILVFNSTYDPIRKKTRYNFLIRNQSGQEKLVNDRQIEPLEI